MNVISLELVELIRFALATKYGGGQEGKREQVVERRKMKKWRKKKKRWRKRWKRDEGEALRGEEVGGRGDEVVEEGLGEGMAEEGLEEEIVKEGLEEMVKEGVEVEEDLFAFPPPISLILVHR